MLIKHIAPIVEAFKYQVRTISSSVRAPSKYKGPVSPGVDSAWRDLFQGKLGGLPARSRITIPQATISKSAQKIC